ncbi:MAG TPA: diaminopimelate decarboxylase [Actinomycetes bacterium]|jgi:diaminopimelate decarboxylase|nr:diaminopimelate decarboxylase [Actinomycetes bacterium]
MGSQRLPERSEEQPFGYRDGVLHVGDLPLDQVVAATGTPAYVYDLDAVAAAWSRVARAFRPIGGQAMYAVKANSNLAVLSRLARSGAGFDVVSGGELLRVLRAGGDPARTVFAGVGKTGDELALAVEHDVLVHVESADELEALQAVAARLGRRGRFAVRVNPDVEVDTHAYIRTGHDAAKFGVAIEVADSLLRRAAGGDFPDLDPAGVHVHVGSQLPDPDGMAAGAKIGIEVIEAGRAAGLAMDWLDLGGGLPIDYAGQPALAPEVFAEALAPVVAGRGLRVGVEPGRYLVGRAGALVARVLYRKHRSAGRMLVVDTGMHQLMRPALYQAVHRVVPVRAAGATWPTEIVGPICESTDVLAAAADLPDLGPGDLVAILDAGAYGMTMASNYNTHPRPPEIVVSAGVAAVARPRETWDDLLDPETIPEL